MKLTDEEVVCQFMEPHKVALHGWAYCWWLVGPVRTELWHRCV